MPSSFPVRFGGQYTVLDRRFTPEERIATPPWEVPSGLDTVIDKIQAEATRRGLDIYIHQAEGHEKQADEKAGDFWRGITVFTGSDVQPIRTFLARTLLFLAKAYPVAGQKPGDL